MELVKASTYGHWEVASSLLTQTVERCNKNGVPLWTHEQVNISSLKSSYSLDSLYLLQHEHDFVGCVFIIFDHDLFWKDFPTQGSLFFHKLAIGDAHNSKGLGTLALAEILSLGKRLGCTWLRCDCHGDRVRLRNFYEQFGFEFIDRQEMFGFDVARYQFPVP
ncbi:GNAT family N-acetyltransferase [Aeromonas sobria]|uniref:GNAT family N-acetyltransferase n=1 Tax=Aeromonas sobria TaxID=646 RepID=UPI0011177ADB|nr:GNAT family N-acetyltransferase [Aeromonas sobria]TNH78270.1 GNAT family N-acetyltransferase [Aeromonas sobria]